MKTTNPFLYTLAVIVALGIMILLAIVGNKMIQDHIDNLARVDTLRMYQRGDDWFYPQEEVILIKNKTYYMELYDSLGNLLFMWEEPEWLIMNNDFILDSMLLPYKWDTIKYDYDYVEGEYEYEKNYTDTF